jgi:hypothetical protein
MTGVEYEVIVFDHAARVLELVHRSEKHVGAAAQRQYRSAQREAIAKRACGSYHGVYSVTRETLMEPASPPRPGSFADIPERNTADNLLRNVQQHHVALSVMADNKANIIITVASIVLTLVFGRMTDTSLRLSALTLGVFTLIALLLAILAVLPKYRLLRPRGAELPEGFNPLFFGHFGGLTRERYLAEMHKVLSQDGTPYVAWVGDIYALGSYLGRHKYRYLRWSYLFFLAGFVLAAAEQAWRLLGSPDTP